MEAVVHGDKTQPQDQELNQWPTDWDTGPAIPQSLRAGGNSHPNNCRWVLGGGLSNLLNKDEERAANGGLWHA